MKKLLIRWAVKQLKKNVRSDMTYHQLAQYGVQDIVQIVGSGTAYIL
jgi:hypothetical protein